MVSLELNQDHCIRCGRCISVCPQRILGRHTNGSVDVLHGALARCIRCGHCVAVCPKAALTLEHIAPSSLPLVEDAPLSDLQRDMLFKTRRSTRAYKDEPVDRSVLLKALEEARNEKIIGKSQEASLTVTAPAALVATAGSFDPSVFEGLFIVASVQFVEGGDEITAAVTVAEGEKCPRCWNIRELGGNPDHPDVCERCGDALDAIEGGAE